MPWAAAAVAAVGVAGSVISSEGQKSAVSKGQQQADARVAPYANQGATSVQDQADLLGLNGSDAATTAMGKFTASPGYQYQVDQGLRAVDAGAASQGIVRSGATLKAEQTLGNNLANQDFGNYINRLNSLSTLGESAATGQAKTDTGAASQQASIYGNEVKGVTSSVQGALGNSGVQNGLSSMFSGGGGSSSVDYGTW